MSNDELITPKAAVKEAREALLLAENELDAAIAKIQAAPRAEKTAVSAVIERALLALRTARTRVEHAEDALATADSA